MPTIVLHASAPRGQSAHWRTAAAVALATLLSWSPPTQAQAPQRLPAIELAAGMHRITAEVARTPQEHQIGLMFRTAMGANEGMLFVFDQPRRQCFWMKNTLIPLSIAFIEDDGTVVNIEEMQARSEAQHCSVKPVRLVLEMNTGWFHKRGVKPGFRLSGTPFSAR